MRYATDPTSSFRAEAATRLVIHRAGAERTKPIHRTCSSKKVCPTTVDCWHVSLENNANGLIVHQSEVPVADYRNCPSVRLSKPPYMVDKFASPDELDPTNVTPSFVARGAVRAGLR